MSITNPNFIVKQDIISDLESYLASTLTEYYSENISDIRTGAFSSSNNLKKIECPNLKKITGTQIINTFGTSSIEELIFPSLEEVINLALGQIPNLKKLVFSSIREVPVNTSTFGNNTAEYIDLSSLIEVPARTSSTGFFTGCINLKTILLDSLERLLDPQTFDNANALEEISLPKVTEIASRCFYRCPVLRTVNLPELVNMPVQIFNGSLLPALSEINAPKLEIAGPSAFQDLPSFTSANFPALKEINSLTFNSIYLTEVNLPALEKIIGSAFFGSTKLTTLDFPSLKFIEGQQTFQGCTNLKTLILRADAVVTLGNTNAFQSSGISASTGEILVPAHLVNSYKAAGSQWYTFRNRIFAI